jgi:IS30 family transposase
MHCHMLSTILGGEERRTISPWKHQRVSISKVAKNLGAPQINAMLMSKYLIV